MESVAFTKITSPYDLVPHQLNSEGETSRPEVSSSANFRHTHCFALLFEEKKN
jgi:hypothetical protein